MELLKGRILKKGAGGFLNPPTHPEHNYSVRNDRDGLCSLSYAVYCEYFDLAIRREASIILASWEPLPLEHQDVQEWIHQVLGYFKNCYADKGSRHVDKLTIDSRDPMQHIDSHAGILLIRDYYPYFIPTAEHFKNAHWGNKPQAKVGA